MYKSRKVIPPISSLTTLVNYIIHYNTVHTPRKGGLDIQQACECVEASGFYDLVCNIYEGIKGNQLAVL